MEDFEKDSDEVKYPTSEDEVHDEIAEVHEGCEALDGTYVNMHDSGERQEFDSGMVRDTGAGKPRPDLISPYANEREGDWLRLGADKYTARNWEKGSPISRCIASLERHVLAYKQGKTDEDHMAAIRTNAGFIIHYEEMIKRGLLPADLDDMPKYEQQDRRELTDDDLS